MANRSRGRKANYEAVAPSLEERCCSNRGCGEQWVDLGSILIIDTVDQ